MNFQLSVHVDRYIFLIVYRYFTLSQHICFAEAYQLLIGDIEPGQWYIQS